MNKEEAQLKIEELEVKLEELKKVVNKPEIKKPFRAERGKGYKYIDVDGRVHEFIENNNDVDDRIYLAGNYSETEEQAEKSNIKKMLGKYDYYLAGISEGFDEIPRDREIEFFFTLESTWKKCSEGLFSNENNNYRWLRHPESDTV